LVTQRTPDALRRLAELLTAEALCLNDLPASPAQALVRAAASSSEVVASLLQKCVADAAAPRAGRALSALVLGAVTRKKEMAGLDEWLLPVYLWGVRRGLPAEPGFAITLLLDGNPELLGRWQAAQSTLASDFALPVEPLRTLLARGTEAERVIALCESMAEPERLASRLKSCILGELDEVASQLEIPEERLYAWREVWRKRCEEHRADFAAIARQSALATGDPNVPQLMVTFLSQMLDLKGGFSSYLTGSPGSPTSSHRSRRQRRLSSTEPLLSPTGRPFLPQRDVAAFLQTTELLWKAALRALRGGQNLSVDLQVEYLRLLVEEGSSWWNPRGLEWGRKNRTPSERMAHLRSWLRQCWLDNGPSLVTLLKRTQDPQLCREVLRLGFHDTLSHCRFRERELYGYALHLARCLNAVRSRWELARLCESLGQFATADDARAAMGPLVEAVRVLPPELLCGAASDVLCEVGTTKSALQSTLPRLGPSLKRLFLHLVHTQCTENLYEGIEALLALDKVVQHKRWRNVSEVAFDVMVEPSSNITSSAVADADTLQEGDEDGSSGRRNDVALQGILVSDVYVTPHCEEWLKWLLEESQKIRREREAAQRNTWFPLGLTARLCAQLADGDLSRFQMGFRAVARTEIEDVSIVERGLEALHRYPGLVAVLATSLTSRPGRVVKVLARLGLTQRLSADAMLPMEPWRGETLIPLQQELPPEWQDVLALTPELAPLAASFVRSQQIREEPISVPAGLRRVLELRHKLASELSHLERLLNAQPERADLAQRAATLRSRLQDEATLYVQIVAEAKERLENAAHESRMATAEWSVEHCFRVQLQNLVGHLPRELAMNDDWFNAVLLLVDITHNRKLLRRLLRAQANGDREWRARGCQATSSSSVAWLSGALV
jgi:hypothetical protein